MRSSHSRRRRTEAPPDRFFTPSERTHSRLTRYVPGNRGMTPSLAQALAGDSERGEEFLELGIDRGRPLRR
jgi:hypothetical protein